MTGGDRQPVLPPGRLGRLRLRAVQPAARVRGLRHDVPRQRRAGRPGEPRPLDRSSGSPSPRSSSACIGLSVELGATRGPARGGTPRTPRRASSPLGMLLRRPVDRVGVGPLRRRTAPRARCTYVAQLVVLGDRAVDRVPATPRPRRASSRSVDGEVDERGRRRASSATIAPRVRRRGDVVRHRRPERRGRRSPALRHGVVQHADDAGRAFVARAARGRAAPSCRRRSADPVTRIGAVCGVSREQRAERHDRAAAGLARDVDHRVAEAAPAQVRLRSGEQHEVAVRRRRRSRPRTRAPATDLAGDTVDERDRRAGWPGSRSAPRGRSIANGAGASAAPSQRDRVASRRRRRRSSR